MKGKSASKSWKKQSNLDATIAVLVLILPFISFLHLLFSTELNKIEFFEIHIDHGFPNNQIFIWFLLLHFSSFSFVLLVFLFSRGPWRYLLLFPIFHFVSYPIWVFNDEPESFSKFLLSGSVVLCIFLVGCLLFLIDHLIKTKLVDQDIKLTFEDGCKEFFEAWNSRCNYEIQKTLRSKPHLSLKEYIHRLYFYAAIMEGMKIEDSSESLNSKDPYRSLRNIGTGTLIAIMSAMLIFQHWIPENQIQFEILGIRIDSFGFTNIRTFFYYASNKLILFALGLIWLATSCYWWRWAILSPVLFYLYQFWEIFQPIRDIESVGNLNILPFVLLTIFVVVLIRALILRISVNRDYHNFLKTELDESLTQLSREENRNYLWQIQVNSPEVL